MGEQGEATLVRLDRQGHRIQEETQALDEEEEGLAGKRSRKAVLSVRCLQVKGAELGGGRAGKGLRSSKAVLRV